MRHAEAQQETESGSDEARSLTVRGHERTRKAAAGLRTLKLRFDAIVTSPLLRATETAELIADEYSNDPHPQVLPALSPNVPEGEAAAALGRFAHHTKVLVVGHEPQLSRLVGLLLNNNNRIAINLKKGACVALDLPKAIEPGAAELCWMLTQRQLRKLRRR